MTKENRRRNEWQSRFVLLGALMVFALSGTVGCKKQLKQFKEERAEKVEEIGGQPKKIIDHVEKLMTDENAKRAAAAMEAANSE